MYIYGNMVQSIKEVVETYEEVTNSDVEMGSITYLQEVAKSTKNEISIARKKNVVVKEFNYHDFHVNLVREHDVDSLINRIFRFSLEAKERKLGSEKDDLEKRKYQANISRQNLQSEVIPTLYVSHKNNNLAVFISTI